MRKQIFGKNINIYDITQYNTYYNRIMLNHTNTLRTSQAHISQIIHLIDKKIYIHIYTHIHTYIHIQYIHIYLIKTVSLYLRNTTSKYIKRTFNVVVIYHLIERRSYHDICTG